MNADRVLTPQSGPVPHSRTSVSAPFWDGCRDHKLRYQRCRECGEANFPPVQTCRNCLSDKLAWRTSRGYGEVYSWTLVHRPVTPEFTPPYAPAIVTLREGYQMLSNIVGISPDDLRIGMPVRVEFHSCAEEVTLPYFTEANRRTTREETE